jgi:hypothetical protein
MREGATAREVTMTIERALVVRLDALADRATGLRAQVGKRGLIGFRDVLAQAIETGVETLERHFEEAATRERLVLTPDELRRGAPRVVAR